MQRYDREAIERAFEFHTIEGQEDFKYLGRDGGLFKVRVRGTWMTLAVREAWVLTFGLAAGREIGKRVAAILDEENKSEGTT